MMKSSGCESPVIKLSFCAAFFRLTLRMSKLLRVECFRERGCRLRVVRCITCWPTKAPNHHGTVDVKGLDLLAETARTRLPEG